MLGRGTPRLCSRLLPCPPTTPHGLEVRAEDEWVASHPKSRPAGPAAQRYPCGATGGALGHAWGTAPPRALSQVPEGGAVAGSVAAAQRAGPCAGPGARDPLRGL